MLNAILVGVLALLAAPAQKADTTFSVPRDARIDVENFRGSVRIRTWDRAAVRVSAEHSSRDRIEIRRTGTLVRIQSSGRLGPARSVDYVVTVPSAAALRVTGAFNHVDIDGAGSDVYVETVGGEIRVRGGNGQIELRSVEGEVVLEDARGRFRLGAVNEGIHVTRVAGDITAETVNGDVRFDRVDSGSVVASTVNGDIAYAGTIRDGGRYSLTTHNGDLTIGVPDGANATISVSTFNGEIESALPITLTELRRNQRFSFTVGQGTARIDLESFNGTIRLRRPATT